MQKQKKAENQVCLTFSFTFLTVDQRHWPQSCTAPYLHLLATCSSTNGCGDSEIYERQVKIDFKHFQSISLVKLKSDLS